MPVGGAMASTTYYCNGSPNPGLSTGDDVWSGNEFVNDTMSGLAGNDYMLGEYPFNGSVGVADTLCGNEDHDAIHGAAGGDWINGGQGADTILDGGYGPDEIHGGSEADEIQGSEGKDIDIFGDDGSDTINGNEGDDVLSGNTDNDTIRGNNDVDVANGNGGTSDDCIAETENGCEI